MKLTIFSRSEVSLSLALADTEIQAPPKLSPKLLQRTLSLEQDLKEITKGMSLKYVQQYLYME